VAGTTKWVIIEVGGINSASGQLFLGPDAYLLIRGQVITNYSCPDKFPRIYHVNFRLKSDIVGGTHDYQISGERRRSIWEIPQKPPCNDKERFHLIFVCVTCPRLAFAWSKIGAKTLFGQRFP